MKILLEIEDSLMREILDFAEEDVCTVEEASAYLIRKGLEKVTSVTLDSDEVDELVESLLSEALQTTKNKPFLLAAIYKKLDVKPAHDWPSLHPTSRKTIGRRFRQAIREHIERMDDDDVVIEFVEKTAQNSALYRVTEKRFV